MIFYINFYLWIPLSSWDTKFHGQKIYNFFRKRNLTNGSLIYWEVHCLKQIVIISWQTFSEFKYWQFNEIRLKTTRARVPVTLKIKKIFFPRSYLRVKLLYSTIDSYNLEKVWKIMHEKWKGKKLSLDVKEPPAPRAIYLQTIRSTFVLSWIIIKKKLKVECDCEKILAVVIKLNVGNILGGFK